MIKKLKQIYRLISPKKISEKESFILSLTSNPNVSKFEKNEVLFTILTTTGQNVIIRDYMHSDYDVFKQVFCFQEYNVVSSMLSFSAKTKNLKIIDAGANIGLTTVYLSQFIHDSTIVLIEPDDENFKILKENIKSLENNNLIILKKALTNEPNMRFQIERNFRDGKDWSISTKENEEGEIEGITINEIKKQYSIDLIDLLKIDIEGAERFIFNKESDLSFLAQTKIIAMEIHDEYNIRKEIIQILVENKFILFDCGELTVGINSHIKW